MHSFTGRTLRRRLLIQIGLTVVGMLAMGVIGIAGVNGLHQDMGVALEGYRELRRGYEVGTSATLARDALNSVPADATRAVAALRMAMLKTERSTGEDGGWQGPLLGERSWSQCREILQRAHESLRRGSETGPEAREAAISDINEALGRLAGLSAEIRQTIAETQWAANQRRGRTMVVMLGLSGLTMVVAVLIGVSQYRGVMRPLMELRRGARTLASGHLESRIAMSGDEEFVALAGDFNAMAKELDNLYRDLEKKVEEKSRELVQSERLASLGYVAAGVAHEINNPLGIIAGYAERSLWALKSKEENPGDDSVRDTLRVICDEAFRCKEITRRLLSLARSGNNDFRPVSLGGIVDEVASNVGGLPQASGRRLEVKRDEADEFRVMGKEGELKQVVLNLLVNAVEAVPAGSGEVVLSLGRREGNVELAVSDNGKGMTAEVQERAFEPFFTNKRGQHGTGLGLSISHAIVRQHGGRITAASGGVGQGSCFTVILPATGEGVAACPS
jgi:two-component system, NtrC family, sensor kinase